MKSLTAIFLSFVVSAPIFAYYDLAKPKVVVGARSLFCASIEYLDKKNVPSEAAVKNLCNSIQTFYTRNSRNLLNFKVKSAKVAVPCKDNRNWDCVKRSVKSKFPNFDMYVLVVGPKIGSSHAGGGVAWMYGTLGRDGQHEVGHLLGLGHAGRYIWERGKKTPTLEAYKDGESVMGRFSSSTLTGPQYRWLSWLPKSEIAVYNPDRKGEVFEIKRVTDTKQQMLSLVGIPVEYSWGKNPDKPAENPHRDTFISFNTKCDMCLTLHLSMGGGSQKVAMIGDEYFDDYFTGVHITILEKSKAKISFTIDFDPKPAGFVNDSEETIFVTGR
jgi:hypothetical protein